MENPLRIVRQNLGIFLVEICGRFHVVEHDPGKNQTKSVWDVDFENKRQNPRSATGWTIPAIQNVAKGRAYCSAAKGFDKAVRERMRTQFVQTLIARSMH